MKMKLLLVTMSAAALTVSADSHAMMRRAPVRVATPRVQRAAQRAFSFAKKENKLQLPQVLPLTEIASARLHNGLLHTHAKYQELLARKKIVDAQYGEVGKEMAVVGASAFVGSVLIGKAMFDANPDLALVFVAGALASPIALMSSGLYGYACAGLGEIDKEYASVTEELVTLARDQKHQLTNPEDKQ